MLDVAPWNKSGILSSEIEKLATSVTRWITLKLVVDVKGSYMHALCSIQHGLRAGAQICNSTVPHRASSSDNIAKMTSRVTQPCKLAQ